LIVKRAIISDIHGNLEALAAVLEDIQAQGIERICCLGDVIGYGPNPRECIDAAMQFDVCILGNHDQGALFDPEGFSSGAERAIFWTRSQLEAANQENGQNVKRWQFLCELPRVYKDEHFLLVHGSPRNPLNEYVFPEDIYNRRKIEKLFGLITSYCFQGHTHVPGVFTEEAVFQSPSEFANGKHILGDRKLMINVGSVGQPRDNDPRSSYVVFDEEKGEVEFRRVDYPIDVTAEKIYAIDELDNFLGDRLKEGR
jgi:predicted phosphodiesterase